MSKEEVGHYFRELFATAKDCRFGNCTHTNEPGCAVQEALVRGDIAISRYESYLSLLGDCTESKYR
jgi:ribosome biogenesis GTPase